MSRPQINQTFGTASDQNAGYYNNAQNSYTQSQNDISDYQDQLSKYASSNPYVEGGQFQTDSNKVIANTNDAGARAAGEKLQSQALRTGQNSAGDVAATEQMEQQGTRNTSAEQAQANNQRIGAGANYNKGTLQATEFPAQFAAGMASSMSGAANKALDTQLGAASWKDPAADTWNKEAAEFVGGQPA
ncbi:MAG: hypothetical protein WCA44_05810 [Acidobacteriaceae bacterium]